MNAYQSFFSLPSEVTALIADRSIQEVAADRCGINLSEIHEKELDQHKLQGSVHGGDATIDSPISVPSMGLVYLCYPGYEFTTFTNWPCAIALKLLGSSKYLLHFIKAPNPDEAVFLWKLAVRRGHPAPRVGKQTVRYQQYAQQLAAHEALCVLSPEQLELYKEFERTAARADIFGSSAVYPSNALPNKLEETSADKSSRDASSEGVPANIRAIVDLAQLSSVVVMGGVYWLQVNKVVRYLPQNPSSSSSSSSNSQVFEPEGQNESMALDSGADQDLDSTKRDFVDVVGNDNNLPRTRNASSRPQIEQQPTNPASKKGNHNHRKTDPSLTFTMFGHQWTMDGRDILLGLQTPAITQVETQSDRESASSSTSSSSATPSDATTVSQPTTGGQEKEKVLVSHTTVGDPDVAMYWPCQTYVVYERGVEVSVTSHRALRQWSKDAPFSAGPNDIPDVSVDLPVDPSTGRIIEFVAVRLCGTHDLCVAPRSALSLFAEEYEPCMKQLFGLEITRKNGAFDQQLKALWKRLERAGVMQAKAAGKSRKSSISPELAKQYAQLEQLLRHRANARKAQKMALAEAQEAWERMHVGDVSSRRLITAASVRVIKERQRAFHDLALAIGALEEQRKIATSAIAEVVRVVAEEVQAERVRRKLQALSTPGDQSICAKQTDSNGRSSHQSSSAQTSQDVGSRPEASSLAHVLSQFCASYRGDGNSSQGNKPCGARRTLLSPESAPSVDMSGSNSLSQVPLVVLLLMAGARTVAGAESAVVESNPVTELLRALGLTNGGQGRASKSTHPCMIDNIAAVLTSLGIDSASMLSAARKKDSAEGKNGTLTSTPFPSPEVVAAATPFSPYVRRDTDLAPDSSELAQIESSIRLRIVATLLDTAIPEHVSMSPKLSRTVQTPSNASGIVYRILNGFLPKPSVEQVYHKLKLYSKNADIPASSDRGGAAVQTLTSFPREVLEFASIATSPSVKGPLPELSARQAAAVAFAAKLIADFLRFRARAVAIHASPTEVESMQQTLFATLQKIQSFLLQSSKQSKGSDDVVQQSLPKFDLKEMSMFGSRVRLETRSDAPVVIDHSAPPLTLTESDRGGEGTDLSPEWFASLAQGSHKLAALMSGATKSPSSLSTSSNELSQSKQSASSLITSAAIECYTYAQMIAPLLLQASAAGGVLSPLSFIGRALYIFWPMDKAWYRCRVRQFNAETQLHFVIYEDGMTEWVDLMKDVFVIADDEADALFGVPWRRSKESVHLLESSSSSSSSSSKSTNRGVCKLAGLESEDEESEGMPDVDQADDMKSIEPGSIDAEFAAVQLPGDDDGFDDYDDNAQEEANTEDDPEATESESESQDSSNKRPRTPPKGGIGIHPSGTVVTFVQDQSSSSPASSSSSLSSTSSSGPCHTSNGVPLPTAVDSYLSIKLDSSLAKPMDVETLRKYLARAHDNLRLVETGAPGVDPLPTALDSDFESDFEEELRREHEANTAFARQTRQFRRALRKIGAQLVKQNGTDSNGVETCGLPEELSDSDSEDEDFTSSVRLVPPSQLNARTTLGDSPISKAHQRDMNTLASPSLQQIPSKDDPLEVRKRWRSAIRHERLRHQGAVKQCWECGEIHSAAPEFVHTGFANDRDGIGYHPVSDLQDALRCGRCGRTCHRRCFRLFVQRTLAAIASVATAARDGIIRKRQRAIEAAAKVVAAAGGEAGAIAMHYLGMPIPQPLLNQLVQQHLSNTTRRKGSLTPQEESMLQAAILANLTKRIKTDPLIHPIEEDILFTPTGHSAAEQRQLYQVSWRLRSNLLASAACGTSVPQLEYPRCPHCIGCEHCGSTNEPETMLTCDICERRCHVKCLPEHADKTTSEATYLAHMGRTNGWICSDCSLCSNCGDIHSSPTDTCTTKVPLTLNLSGQIESHDIADEEGDEMADSIKSSDQMSTSVQEGASTESSMARPQESDEAMVDKPGSAILHSTPSDTLKTDLASALVPKTCSNDAANPFARRQKGIIDIDLLLSLPEKAALEVLFPEVMDHPASTKASAPTKGTDASERDAVVSAGEDERRATPTEGYQISMTAEMTLARAIRYFCRFGDSVLFSAGEETHNMLEPHRSTAIQTALVSSRTGRSMLLRHGISALTTALNAIPNAARYFEIAVRLPSLSLARPIDADDSTPRPIISAVAYEMGLGIGHTDAPVWEMLANLMDNTLVHIPTFWYMGKFKDYQGATSSDTDIGSELEYSGKSESVESAQRESNSDAISSSSTAESATIQSPLRNSPHTSNHIPSSPGIKSAAGRKDVPAPFRSANMTRLAQVALDAMLTTVDISPYANLLKSIERRQITLARAEAYEQMPPPPPPPPPMDYTTLFEELQRVLIEELDEQSIGSNIERRLLGWDHSLDEVKRSKTNSKSRQRGEISGVVPVGRCIAMRDLEFLPAIARMAKQLLQGADLSEYNAAPIRRTKRSTASTYTPAIPINATAPTAELPADAMSTSSTTDSAKANDDAMAGHGAAQAASSTTMQSETIGPHEAASWDNILTMLQYVVEHILRSVVKPPEKCIDMIPSADDYFYSVYRCAQDIHEHTPKLVSSYVHLRRAAEARATGRTIFDYRDLASPWRAAQDRYPPKYRFTPGSFFFLERLRVRQEQRRAAMKARGITRYQHQYAASLNPGFISDLLLLTSGRVRMNLSKPHALEQLAQPNDKASQALVQQLIQFAMARSLPHAQVLPSRSVHPGDKLMYTVETIRPVLLQSTSPFRSLLSSEKIESVLQSEVGSKGIERLASDLVQSQIVEDRLFDEASVVLYFPTSKNQSADDQDTSSKSRKKSVEKDRALPTAEVAAKRKTMPKVVLYQVALQVDIKDATSGTTPLSGEGDLTFGGYYCEGCGTRSVQRNYCPVCAGVWFDRDCAPMIECDGCLRWVHSACDGISDSVLIEVGGEEIKYQCPECLLHRRSDLLLEVIDELQKHDKFDFFGHPVTDEEAPNYSIMIKVPMDFSVMRNKLNKLQYEDVESFKHDLNLIWRNAIDYNPPRSPVFKLAVKLQALSVGLIARAEARFKRRKRAGGETGLHSVTGAAVIPSTTASSAPPISRPPDEQTPQLQRLTSSQDPAKDDATIKLGLTLLSPSHSNELLLNTQTSPGSAEHSDSRESPLVESQVYSNPLLEPLGPVSDEVGQFNPSPRDVLVDAGRWRATLDAASAILASSVLAQSSIVGLESSSDIAPSKLKSFRRTLKDMEAIEASMSTTATIAAIHPRLGPVEGFNTGVAAQVATRSSAVAQQVLLPVAGTIWSSLQSLKGSSVVRTLKLVERVSLLRDVQQTQFGAAVATTVLPGYARLHAADVGQIISTLLREQARHNAQHYQITAAHTPSQQQNLARSYLPDSTAQNAKLAVSASSRVNIRFLAGFLTSSPYSATQLAMVVPADLWGVWSAVDAQGRPKSLSRRAVPALRGHGILTGEALEVYRAAELRRERRRVQLIEYEKELKRKEESEREQKALLERQAQELREKQRLERQEKRAQKQLQKQQRLQQLLLQQQSGHDDSSEHAVKHEPMSGSPIKTETDDAMTIKSEEQAAEELRPSPSAPPQELKPEASDAETHNAPGLKTEHVAADAGEEAGASDAETENADDEGVDPDGEGETQETDEAAMVDSQTHSVVKKPKPKKRRTRLTLPSHDTDRSRRGHKSATLREQIRAKIMHQAEELEVSRSLAMPSELGASSSNSAQTLQTSNACAMDLSGDELSDGESQRHSSNVDLQVQRQLRPDRSWLSINGLAGVDLCEACGSSGDADEMLICQGCSAPIHSYCVRPGVSKSAAREAAISAWLRIRAALVRYAETAPGTQGKSRNASRIPVAADCLLAGECELRITLDMIESNSSTVRQLADSAALSPAWILKQAKMLAHFSEVFSLGPLPDMLEELVLTSPEIACWHAMLSWKCDTCLGHSFSLGGALLAPMTGPLWAANPTAVDLGLRVTASPGIALTALSSQTQAGNTNLVLPQVQDPAPSTPPVDLPLTPQPALVIVRCAKCLTPRESQRTDTRLGEGNVYLCANCVMCQSCGTRAPNKISFVPQNKDTHSQTLHMWQQHMTLCLQCDRLQTTGHSCQVCSCVWRESNDLATHVGNIVSAARAVKLAPPATLLAFANIMRVAEASSQTDTDPAASIQINGEHEIFAKALAQAVASETLLTCDHCSAKVHPVCDGIAPEVIQALQRESSHAYSYLCPLCRGGAIQTAAAARYVIVKQPERRGGRGHGASSAASSVSSSVLSASASATAQQSANAALVPSYRACGEPVDLFGKHPPLPEGTLAYKTSRMVEPPRPTVVGGSAGFNALVAAGVIPNASLSDVFFNQQPHQSGLDTLRPLVSMSQSRTRISETSWWWNGPVSMIRFKPENNYSGHVKAMWLAPGIPMPLVQMEWDGRAASSAPIAKAVAQYAPVYSEWASPASVSMMSPELAPSFLPRTALQQWLPGWLGKIAKAAMEEGQGACVDLSTGSVHSIVSHALRTSLIVEGVKHDEFLPSPGMIVKAWQERSKSQEVAGDSDQMKDKVTGPGPRARAMPTDLSLVIPAFVPGGENESILCLGSRMPRLYLPRDSELRQRQRFELLAKSSEFLSELAVARAPSSDTEVSSSTTTAQSKDTDPIAATTTSASTQSNTSASIAVGVVLPFTADLKPIADDLLMLSGPSPRKHAAGEILLDSRTLALTESGNSSGVALFNSLSSVGSHPRAGAQQSSMSSEKTLGDGSDSETDDEGALMKDSEPKDGSSVTKERGRGGRMPTSKLKQRRLEALNEIRSARVAEEAAIVEQGGDAWPYQGMPDEFFANGGDRDGRSAVKPTGMSGPIEDDDAAQKALEAALSVTSLFAELSGVVEEVQRKRRRLRRRAIIDYGRQYRRAAMVVAAAAEAVRQDFIKTTAIRAAQKAQLEGLSGKDVIAAVTSIDMTGAAAATAVSDATMSSDPNMSAGTVSEVTSTSTADLHNNESIKGHKFTLAQLREQQDAAAAALAQVPTPSYKKLLVQLGVKRRRSNADRSLVDWATLTDRGEISHTDVVLPYYLPVAPVLPRSDVPLPRAVSMALTTTAARIAGFSETPPPSDHISTFPSISPILEVVTRANPGYVFGEQTTALNKNFQRSEQQRMDEVAAAQRAAAYERSLTRGGSIAGSTTTQLLTESRRGPKSDTVDASLRDETLSAVFKLPNPGLRPTFQTGLAVVVTSESSTGVRSGKQQRIRTDLAADAPNLRGGKSTSLVTFKSAFAQPHLAHVSSLDSTKPARDVVDIVPHIDRKIPSFGPIDAMLPLLAVLNDPRALVTMSVFNAPVCTLKLATQQILPSPSPKDLVLREDAGDSRCCVFCGGFGDQSAEDYDESSERWLLAAGRLLPIGMLPSSRAVPFLYATRTKNPSELPKFEDVMDLGHVTQDGQWTVRQGETLLSSTIKTRATHSEGGPIDTPAWAHIRCLVWSTGIAMRFADTHQTLTALQIRQPPLPGQEKTAGVEGGDPVPVAGLSHYSTIPPSDRYVDAFAIRSDIKRLEQAREAGAPVMLQDAANNSASLLFGTRSDAAVGAAFRYGKLRTGKSVIHEDLSVANLAKQSHELWRDMHRRRGTSGLLESPFTSLIIDHARTVAATAADVACSVCNGTGASLRCALTSVSSASCSPISADSLGTITPACTCAYHYACAVRAKCFMGLLPASSPVVAALGTLTNTQPEPAPGSQQSNAIFMPIVLCPTHAALPKLAGEGTADSLFTDSVANPTACQAAGKLNSKTTQDSLPEQLDDLSASLHAHSSASRSAIVDQGTLAQAHAAALAVNHAVASGGAAATEKDPSRCSALLTYGFAHRAPTRMFGLVVNNASTPVKRVEVVSERKNRGSAAELAGLVSPAPMFAESVLDGIFAGASPALPATASHKRPLGPFAQLVLRLHLECVRVPGNAFLRRRVLVRDAILAPYTAATACNSTPTLNSLLSLYPGADYRLIASPAAAALAEIREFTATTGSRVLLRNSLSFREVGMPPVRWFSPVPKLQRTLELGVSTNPALFRVCEPKHGQDKIFYLTAEERARLAAKAKIDSDEIVNYLGARRTYSQATQNKSGETSLSYEQLCRQIEEDTIQSRIRLSELASPAVKVYDFAKQPLSHDEIAAQKVIPYFAGRAPANESEMTNLIQNAGWNQVEDFNQHFTDDVMRPLSYSSKALETSFAIAEFDTIQPLRRFSAVLPMAALRLGSLTIHSIGDVVPLAPSFHAATHVIPLGFVSSRMMPSTVCPGTRVPWTFHVTASVDHHAHARARRALDKLVSSPSWTKMLETFALAESIAPSTPDHMQARAQHSYLSISSRGGDAVVGTSYATRAFAADSLRRVHLDPTSVLGIAARVRAKLLRLGLTAHVITRQDNMARSAVGGGDQNQLPSADVEVEDEQVESPVDSVKPTMYEVLITPIVRFKPCFVLTAADDEENPIVEENGNVLELWQQYLDRLNPISAAEMDIQKHSSDDTGLNLSTGPKPMSSVALSLLTYLGVTHPTVIAALEQQQPAIFQCLRYCPHTVTPPSFATRVRSLIEHYRLDEPLLHALDVLPQDAAREEEENILNLLEDVLTSLSDEARKTASSSSPATFALPTKPASSSVVECDILAPPPSWHVPQSDGPQKCLIVPSAMGTATGSAATSVTGLSAKYATMIKIRPTSFKLRPYTTHKRARAQMGVDRYLARLSGPCADLADLDLDMQKLYGTYHYNALPTYGDLNLLNIVAVCAGTSASATRVYSGTPVFAPSQNIVIESAYAAATIAAFASGAFSPKALGYENFTNFHTGPVSVSAVKNPGLALALQNASAQPTAELLGPDGETPTETVAGTVSNTVLSSGALVPPTTTGSSGEHGVPLPAASAVLPAMGGVFGHALGPSSNGLVHVSALVAANRTGDGAASSGVATTTSAGSNSTGSATDATTHMAAFGAGTTPVAANHGLLFNAMVSRLDWASLTSAAIHVLGSSLGATLAAAAAAASSPAGDKRMVLSSRRPSFSHLFRDPASAGAVLTVLDSICLAPPAGIGFEAAVARGFFDGLPQYSGLIALAQGTLVPKPQAIAPPPLPARVPEGSDLDSSSATARAESISAQLVELNDDEEEEIVRSVTTTSATTTTSTNASKKSTKSDRSRRNRQSANTLVSVEAPQAVSTATTDAGTRGISAMTTVTAAGLAAIAMAASPMIPIPSQYAVYRTIPSHHAYLLRYHPDFDLSDPGVGSTLTINCDHEAAIGVNQAAISISASTHICAAEPASLIAHQRQAFIRKRALAPSMAPLDRAAFCGTLGPKIHSRHQDLPRVLPAPSLTAGVVLPSPGLTVGFGTVPMISTAPSASVAAAVAAPSYLRQALAAAATQAKVANSSVPAIAGTSILASVDANEEGLLASLMPPGVRLPLTPSSQTSLVKMLIGSARFASFGLVSVALAIPGLAQALAAAVAAPPSSRTLSSQSAQALRLQKYAQHQLMVLGAAAEAAAVVAGDSARLNAPLDSIGTGLCAGGSSVDSHLLARYTSEAQSAAESAAFMQALGHKGGTMSNLLQDRSHDEMRLVDPTPLGLPSPSPSSTTLMLSPTPSPLAPPVRPNNPNKKLVSLSYPKPLTQFADGSCVYLTPSGYCLDAGGYVASSGGAMAAAAVETAIVNGAIPAAFSPNSPACPITGNPLSATSAAKAVTAAGEPGAEQLTAEESDLMGMLQEDSSPSGMTGDGNASASADDDALMGLGFGIASAAAASASTAAQDGVVRAKYGDPNAKTMDRRISAEQYKAMKSEPRSIQPIVGHSPIHEWGLFATQDYQPDQMIIEYLGELIRQKVSDAREQRYESLNIVSTYMFKINDDLIVDSTKQGNASRFINHSCDPNCYTRVVNVDGEPKIVVLANRFVPRGAELTYDYCFSSEEERIECHCGTPKCSGRLN